MARLRHPTVVSVYDFGTMPDGTPYYTMEYLSGRPADALLRAGDWHALLMVGAEIAHGLEVLHAQGIVHGDLKPSNVLVLPTSPGDSTVGSIRLVDFGLAAALGDARGARRGTSGFAAPEVVRGTPASVASDLYALGATFFSLGDGCPPFGGGSPETILRRRLTRPPDRRLLEERVAPRSLIELVLQLLAKDPRERPQATSDVRRELESIAPSIRRPLAERLGTATLASDPLSGLHLFYSDKPRSWGELPVPDGGSEGVAVSALDDTTAHVALANLGGPISWGVERGSTWIGGDQVIPDDYTYGPVLRPRASGGQWLAWAAVDEHVAMMSYRHGSWSPPKTLRCAYRSPGQHFSNSVSLGRDSGEYPAVAWSSEISGSIVTCACMPVGSVYNLADELDNGSSDGIPTVARDANGDVWVAWWRYFDGMFWTHSYTTAVAGSPRVVGVGRDRALAWTLTEPAPGTWWTVQRSGGQAPHRPSTPGRADTDGLFEDVARLQAGDDSVISWTDRSPPAGVLRYRIRRDCVDKRYEWPSGEATWPPQNLKPRPVRLSTGGVGAGGELVLDGAAAGTFEIRVYDVQGRLVHLENEVAETGASKTFRVGLRPGANEFRAGVYFVLVRDALGRESNAVKTVILR